MHDINECLFESKYISAKGKQYELLPDPGLWPVFILYDELFQAIGNIPGGNQRDLRESDAELFL